jgi:pyruvate,water dikinase
MPAGACSSTDGALTSVSRSSAGSAERPQPERRSGAVPAIVELTDGRAGTVALTGGKAAALARAAANGLKVLPGVVLSTAFCADVDGGARVAGHADVAEAFRRAGGDRHPLVARSSSVVEDTATSSMAGQFDSVIGISGLAAFEEAVQTVLASRQRTGTMDHPIAVLVQPLLEPAFGGVLFGVDPVSGRSDHRVVSAVSGAPERLVSGEVIGSWYVLDDAGKVVFVEQGDGPELSRSTLRRLAALAIDAAEVFGRPQDVEWAIAEDGELWLLQSRPVTTEVRGVPQGPVYGPGPVAETFPEALTELEYDLWCRPCARPSGRRCCSQAPPPRPSSTPATSWSAWTATWRSTCGWRASCRPGAPAPAASTCSPGPDGSGTRGGSAASGAPCPASPSTCSTGSTPTWRASRRSVT